MKIRYVLILSVALLNACADIASSGDKASQSALNKAKAHTDLASAYLGQNRLAVALEEFNLAIEAAPSFAGAHNGLAMVYAALGEDAKAEASFKKALQLQPDSSESHNNYGNFLCARARYSESIQEYLAAVKNPLYSTPNLAYANAGICSARKKDFKSAEAYLNQALIFDPLTHSAAFQLANIQFNRGEVNVAQKTLQNALIASPTPDVLWLGVKIARAQNDKDAEASYALQLRRQYPNAPETQLLLSGN